MVGFGGVPRSVADNFLKEAEPEVLPSKIGRGLARWRGRQKALQEQRVCAEAGDRSEGAWGRPEAEENVTFGPTGAWGEVGHSAVKEAMLEELEGSV